jgi:hypothetical protein
MKKITFFIFITCCQLIKWLQISNFTGTGQIDARLFRLTISKTMILDQIEELFLH